MDSPLETPDVVDKEAPHPLTIHLIAGPIFSHLESILDLMRCREVAWAWRQMVTPLINSKSQEFTRMTFSGSEGEIKNPNNSDAASLPLSKLLQYINYLKEEADMEPKFMLSHFRFYNLLLEQPIVQQFLNQFGHTVRKMELDANDQPDYRKFDKRYNSCRYYERRSKTRRYGSVETLWRMLSTQCTKFDDLKFGQVYFEPTSDDKFPPFRTTLKRLTFFDHWVKEEHKPLITNLLRNCHSLERLLLKHIADFSEVLSFAFKESPHLSALKELTVDHVKVMPLEDLAGSENIQKNLRLKKLQIEHLRNEHVDELNLFLQTQKTSLETLIIEMWYYFFKPGDTVNIIQPVKLIPSADVMEKLREFRISIDFKDAPLAYQPIDFQRQFPSLNKLILEGDLNKDQMDSLFVAGSEPQLTLEGLQLPEGISQEHLARAGEIFPNVKQLRIGKLGELAVRQLFSQWPHLESLFLEAFEGHDSILTGLSPKQLEAAEKLRVKIGREIHGIMSLISPSKVAPSIRNFKDLKVLRLKSHSSQPLTDLSLRYGISKLNNLEFLSVSGQKFSEEGIKDLLNSIPDFQLYTNEEKKWGEFHCQRDLSKKFQMTPFCNEKFAD